MHQLIPPDSNDPSIERASTFKSSRIQGPLRTKKNILHEVFEVFLGDAGSESPGSQNTADAAILGLRDLMPFRYLHRRIVSPANPRPYPNPTIDSRPLLIRRDPMRERMIFRRRGES